MFYKYGKTNIKKGIEKCLNVFNLILNLNGFTLQ